MSTIAAAIGRILLAIVFIVLGARFLFDPAGAGQAFAQFGLNPQLAIPVGIVQLVAGAMLALAVMTRLAALVLIVLLAADILFFNHQFTTTDGMTRFLLDLGLIGGLLGIFAHSQMVGEYRTMKLRREGEISTRDAERKAHEAELRAARAEGRVEGTPATPAPTATTVIDIDRDKDGVDDRAKVAPPGAKVDRDNDGVDDRAEPTRFDPRLRP